MGFRRPSGWTLALAFLLAGVSFAVAVESLKPYRHPRVSGEIEVALPLFVQVLMTGGDRFLAANLGSIRALITETAKMRPDEYAIQAKVQLDASWLNPAHEDNYFVASATLPWNGQIDAAQSVLHRASLVRPYDYQPAFYYAFNLVHFKGDFVAASAWLREAAVKLPDEEERLTMQFYAAAWLDRSDDLGLSIAVIESMAQQSKRKDFREMLMLRASRLRDLMGLRKAAELYRERTGRPLAALSELLEAGLIKVVPLDPMGIGYSVDNRGIPVFVNTLK